MCNLSLKCHYFLKASLYKLVIFLAFAFVIAVTNDPPFSPQSARHYSSPCEPFCCAARRPFESDAKFCNFDF